MLDHLVTGFVVIALVAVVIGVALQLMPRPTGRNRRDEEGDVPFADGGGGEGPGLRRRIGGDAASDVGDSGGGDGGGGGD